MLRRSRHKGRSLLTFAAFRWAQAGLMALCWVPLLFPDQLPMWAGPVAIFGLGLIFASGPLWAGHPAFESTPLDLPLLGLMVILPLNLLISADRHATLPQLYRIVAGTTAYYGAVGVLRDRRVFGLAGWGFAALGMVLGGLLVLGTNWSASGFSRLPESVRALIPQWTPFWKPEGYAGFNVNLAGGTLALVLPVPVGFVLWGRRWWVRLVMLGEVVLLGGLLVLTLSRGAIVSLGAALLVMLVAYDRRWLWLLGAIVLSVGGVIAWQGPAQVVEVVLGSGGGGVMQGLDSRVELWSRGIYMMQDFAFTGVGMGMVGQVLPLLYPTFLIPPDAGIDHVHNLYLQFGAEVGFPGLILLLSCFLLLLALHWRGIQRARGMRWAPLATGLLGTVVALMAHGVVDSVMLAPKVYLITWSIFGLSVALDLALLEGELGPNA